MNAPDETPEKLAFEFEIDEPFDKVWRALTTPEVAKLWMLPEEAAENADAVCELLLTTPPDRVSYLWSLNGEPETMVTFVLRPMRAGSTLLRLIHSEYQLEITGPVAMLRAA